MDLTPGLRELITRTAHALPLGAARRRYMADTIATLQLGQRQAQTLFGWGRDTIRKAFHERRRGITCVDAFRCRGRKPAEAHLPRLLADIRDIVQDYDYPVCFGFPVSHDKENYTLKIGAGYKLKVGKSKVILEE